MSFLQQTIAFILGGVMIFILALNPEIMHDFKGAFLAPLEKATKNGGAQQGEGFLPTVKPPQALEDARQRARDLQARDGDIPDNTSLTMTYDYSGGAVYEPGKKRADYDLSDPGAKYDPGTAKAERGRSGKVIYRYAGPIPYDYKTKKGGAEKFKRDAQKRLQAEADRLKRKLTPAEARSVIDFEFGAHAVAVQRAKGL